MLLLTILSQYTHSIPKAFNRHHYGGWHLQIQTGSLHFNVWYSGITSTDQPCRTRKTYNSGVPRCMFLNNQASRVQGNLSYFPLSCIMQLIFCHNQGILMWILWQLHMISSKRLSCRHQVLKGICGGRDNWLHQQVYHP